MVRLTALDGAADQRLGTLANREENTSEDIGFLRLPMIQLPKQQNIYIQELSKVRIDDTSR